LLALFVEHRNRGQCHCGVSLDSINQAKHICANLRDLACGLDQARGRSGARLMPATTKFNLYSAVSAGWSRDAAAAIVAVLSAFAQTY
jgi:hypothetical protein